MHQVLITYHKKTGNYQVIARQLKRILFINYWLVLYKTRGPAGFIYKRAFDLAELYNCEVTDKTGNIWQHNVNSLRY